MQYPHDQNFPGNYYRIKNHMTANLVAKKKRGNIVVFSSQCLVALRGLTKCALFFIAFSSHLRNKVIPIEVFVDSTRHSFFEC